MQIYIELPQRIRAARARELFPGAHIEARRGSAAEASDYCRKDGDFEEYGTISNPAQGRRVDLEALHTDLQEKKSLAQISDDHFGSFLRYERSIRSYINMRVPDRQYPPTVVVYWGATGLGKTRAIYDNLPSLDNLFLYPGSGWFDGYVDQPIALFDDFSGSEFKINYLLKLLDRYPIKVPVKGSFVHWQPREIYLTSNLDPRNWYSGAHPEHVEALFRRFSFIFKFQ